MRFGLWLLAICTISTSGVLADDAVWKLVWEDDFERTELGGDWPVQDNLSIVDGRLYLKGRCDAKINRSFAPDVKVQFVAEADPELPPCDLSIMLANSHLLAFGGGNNQFNQIVGGGAHTRDRNPPFLIEHGKKYKLVAVKEGPKLMYFVNDTKLLEADVEDPLGGPGFDGVTLVTWKGMYVDYIKVYERTTPAQEGPVIMRAMPALGYVWKDRTLTYVGSDGLPADVARGVREYNERKYADAVETLSAISPPTLTSVAALAYVVGDLGYQARPEVQQKLADLAAEVARRMPDSSEAGDFALAADRFSRITFRSRDHRATRRIIGMGPENNPFYYKARLFETRYNYAHAIEGAQRSDMAAAIQEFGELKKLWPEHRALREWTGEKIPWGEDLIRDESDGPAWARNLNEAFVRQQRILEWWFSDRQAPDGSLGGGWGDDVEILRSWVPVACITTAGEPVIAGIERLAQGVWDHVLEDGYDRGSGDVEHSAEPSCDSMPTMILLRYGDPKWIEQNLRSAKTIREKFMGINDRGFLHFYSAEFGMEGVNRQIQGGGDTGYHARAAKHFIWLGWYGIPDGRDAFLQWCEGWRDVTMRQIGTKPPGIVPASVWFPSGDIAPPNGKPWYDDEFNYYGFPGLPGMIHDSFLTAYLLSGDRRFLDPVVTMMEMATVGPLRTGAPALPPDHIENLLAKVAHQSDNNVTAVYRWLTGENVYDEYTLRYPTPTQRYFIDYDLEKYGRSFEGMAERMRYNWTQFTSEVMQTDRAGLAGATEVCGAYTGAVRSFRDSGAPTHSVTYDTPDLNFAAVVTETTPERLRVRFYNFNEDATRMGLRPWRLVPGKYVLMAGGPVTGERPVQSRYTWGTPVEVDHIHRGTPIYVDVPSRKEWVVDLRLREAIDRPKCLPDLAISDEDIRAEGKTVTVTVHNIGSDKAGPFDVALILPEAKGGDELARARVDGLPAISNFNPVTQDVRLQISKPCNGSARVLIDPSNEVDELYELNNAVTLTMK